MSHHLPSHADAHRTLSGRQINTSDGGVIVNPNEIRKKLVYLLNKKTLLVISGVKGSASVDLLTTITHIDDGHIFFGGFQNEKRNSDLLKNGELIVSADIEDASVRFKIIDLGGYGVGAAFVLRACVPQSMQWIRRRNARRVKVPINASIKVQHKNNARCFDVIDISVTGLSYIDKSDDHYFSSVGERHADCSIVMPDKSIIMDCFEIANSSPAFSYLRHDQGCRVGCEIKRVSSKLDTALQYLINQIDLGRL